MVIECKSPFVTDPIQSGINQLMRYANRRNPSDDEGAEKLFHYNQMMISTSAYKSRVGTITSNVEHYLEWKDPTHSLSVSWVMIRLLQVMIAGLFTKTNLLDIIQNFIVFEPMDGRSRRRWLVTSSSGPCIKPLNASKQGKVVRNAAV